MIKIIADKKKRKKKKRRKGLPKKRINVPKNDL